MNEINDKSHVPTPRPTVLFVHQSAGLYGSDKVILNLALGIGAKGFCPVVLVPNEGPLVDRLREAGVECHILPIGKMARATLSPRGLIGLAGELWRLARQARRLGLHRRVDIIYSNTLATIGGALLAALWRKPNVWHVHEIIHRPKPVAALFPRLVAWGSTSVISNSNQTAAWLHSVVPSLAAKDEVIWNGIGPARADGGEVARLRDGWGVRPGEVVVALIGRFNRGKGHWLLIDALELLPAESSARVRLVFVGSVWPGQEVVEQELRARAAASPLAARIVFQPFVDEIDSVWSAVDIAAVPSTEPESFGLVAIEAMRAGKPVVAAAQGGLLEVVKDGETGLLFEPRDAQALARAVAGLLGDAPERERLGEAGRARQQELFSLTAQIDQTGRHLARQL